MMTTYCSQVPNICEVCGSIDLQQVLDLGVHPLCDDLVPITETRQCLRFPIKIMYCNNCNTAHQMFRVEKTYLFPKNYHYRSRFTADVLSGMVALVDSLEHFSGPLVGKTVLDIGCNDGSLLDLFLAKGATTIGVEPTSAFQDAEHHGHRIINDYFSEKIAQEIADSTSCIDVITFTNVFAHIEDLPSLIKALKLIMNEKTILVIENHYLGSVLTGNQFDTFYHEHPRTYSLNSFVHIAKLLASEVLSVEFPKRYGGNIRVIIGNKKLIKPGTHSLIEEILTTEASFHLQFGLMNEFISQWKTKTKARILDLVTKYGKLKAKAFPGRSAILVALLELSSDQIECVYEKPGSLKVGHYLPGSRIPIVSDSDLFACIDRVPVILNLAWHIPDEISTYLKEHRFTGKIIQIL